MKRVLAAAVAALVGSLPACGGEGGGGAAPKSAPGDDVVGWQTDLEKDAPLLEYFARKAEAYGCKTVKSTDEGVAEQCHEGPIIMLKKGLRVTVGCKAMSLEDCRGLFQRITEAP